MSRLTDEQLNNALTLLHALTFWTGQPQVKALGLKIDGISAKTDEYEVRTLEQDRAEASELLQTLYSQGKYHPNNQIDPDEFEARTGKKFRNQKVSAANEQT